MNLNELIRADFLWEVDYSIILNKELKKTVSTSEGFVWFLRIWQTQTLNHVTFIKGKLLSLT